MSQVITNMSDNRQDHQTLKSIPELNASNITRNISTDKDLEDVPRVNKIPEEIEACIASKLLVWNEVQNTQYVENLSQKQRQLAFQEIFSTLRQEVEERGKKAKTKRGKKRPDPTFAPIIECFTSMKTLTECLAARQSTRNYTCRAAQEYQISKNYSGMLHRIHTSTFKVHM